MTNNTWQEDTFPTRDGLKLFSRFFAAGPGSDVMVILHGHGEHSGRYDKFAKELRGENLSIGVFDFRGHGRSEGPRVYFESFEDYLEDVTSFVSFLEKNYGIGGKIILLGHSVGGLVAAHWAARCPGRLKALVLSSPCLGLRLPRVLVKFNALLNGFIPAFAYRNPVYPPHLTHNPEEVIAYRNDNLIQRKMSVRLLHEILTYQVRLEAEKSFSFPFPVFLLMAELEKVVDPKITREYFGKIRAPLKELKVFPGFYHEIFNELWQDQVFAALKECLKKSRQAGGT